MVLAVDIEGGGSACSAARALAAAPVELRAVPLEAQISRTRREAKEEERKLDSMRGK